MTRQRTGYRKLHGQPQGVYGGAAIAQINQVTV